MCIDATSSTIADILREPRSANEDLKWTNEKLTQLRGVIQQYAVVENRSSPSYTTSNRVLAVIDKSINIISEIDPILADYRRRRLSWEPDGKAMMSKPWQDLRVCKSDWERVTETVVS